MPLAAPLVVQVVLSLAVQLEDFAELPVLTLAFPAVVLTVLDLSPVAPVEPLEGSPAGQPVAPEEYLLVVLAALVEPLEKFPVDQLVAPVAQLLVVLAAEVLVQEVEDNDIKYQDW